jgi:hypothetical protein
LGKRLKVADDMITETVWQDLIWRVKLLTFFVVAQASLFFGLVGVLIWEISRG